MSAAQLLAEKNRRDESEYARQFCVMLDRAGLLSQSLELRSNRKAGA